MKRDIFAKKNRKNYNKLIFCFFVKNKMPYAKGEDPYFVTDLIC